MRFPSWGLEPRCTRSIRAECPNAAFRTVAQNCGMYCLGTRWAVENLEGCGSRATHEGIKKGRPHGEAHGGGVTAYGLQLGLRVVRGEVLTAQATARQLCTCAERELRHATDEVHTEALDQERQSRRTINNRSEVWLIQLPDCLHRTVSRIASREVSAIGRACGLPRSQRNISSHGHHERQGNDRRSDERCRAHACSFDSRIRHCQSASRQSPPRRGAALLLRRIRLNHGRESNVWPLRSTAPEPHRDNGKSTRAALAPMPTVAGQLGGASPLS